MRPARTMPVSLAAVAVGAALSMSGAATGWAESAATTPGAPTTPAVDCATAAASTAGAPPILTTVRAAAGKVEVRGAFTSKGRAQFLTVEGCTFANQLRLERQEYVLLRAPRTHRWAAVLTGFTRRDEGGAISVVDAVVAPLKTERQFDGSIRGLTRMNLPGLRGSVYALKGSGIRLLASRVKGRRVSDESRTALAARYVASGGYVTPRRR